MKRLSLFLFLIVAAACSPTPAVLSPTVTSTRAPGVVALISTPKPLPTAIAIDQQISFDNLSIKIGSVEVNDVYKTEYGPSRDAPDGMKFLWVQLLVENTDDDSIQLPGEDHFSVVFDAKEYKPTYGHRDGFPDYTSPGDTLFPGDPREGWLRFDIPAEAELKDLQFAFLPESTRITFTRTQSGSSMFDHPVFLWRLEAQ